MFITEAISKMFKEPLIQFLVIGLSFWIGSQSYRNEISLDEETKKLLLNEKQSELGRHLSRSEIKTTLELFLEEEVLYQEALRLGLDKNDDVVRRRLVQKMEFIFKERHRISKLSNSEIENYIVKHRHRFTLPDRYTFSQVYFRTAEHRLPLDKKYLNLSLQEIEAIFGPKFSNQVSSLAVKKWSEPIESAFGFHKVFIHKVARGEAMPSPLAKEIARDEIMLNRETKGLAESLLSLKRKYGIIGIKL